MLSRSTPGARRPGAIVPLAAVLMTFILALVAFAVDIGWIVVARSELQNAADAAALAGADPLMDGSIQYSLAPEDKKADILSTSLSSARTRAKLYASYNSAGGVSGLVLADGDIEFGFTAQDGTYTALPTYTGFPNTIKVTMRRDGTANGNGSLSLFFAPVLGVRNMDLGATASATTMGGSINSFAQTPPRNIRLLPMTYDVNSWNNYLQTGKWPDGTLSLADNGVPQIQVYPSVKDTGNFGMLTLDDSHAGASTIRDWIDNGMSTTDLSALISNGLLPLSEHDSTKWDWLGDPGFKASDVMTVNDYTNEIFLLPLFTPKSTGSDYQAGVGNGSHYNYQIVQFVGIKIMPVSDINRQVVVQPAAVVDPYAIFSGQAVPGGTTSSTMTTFTAPKLSR